MQCWFVWRVIETVCVCVCVIVCSYAVLLLVINYVAPLTALVVAYSIIGKQLWGSQAIGERTPGQEETIRSKRRVCCYCGCCYNCIH